MDLRDYHFHLFLEDATLAPAILHHGGPTGYRLIRAVAAGPADTTLPLTIDPETAPVLRVAQAIDRLNAAPAYRFLFFVDPSSGCGQVLYRRYDGHLGLLTAAW